MVLVLDSLTSDDLKAIEAAVLDLDPAGLYVKLDVSDNRIEYSASIKSHERFTSYVGTEEPVRAYWVAWLCTTGVYPPSALELERSYAYGSAGNAQLDIRIADPEDPNDAYALIELKAPNDWGGVNDKRIKSQLFALTGEEPEVSVLSLSTLQVNEAGEVRLVGINIARDDALTYDKWRLRKSRYVDTFPVNYDKPTSEPFIVGGPRDLNLGLTRIQLDRTRLELHNKLWGGSRDDNQIYAWLVRLFLTKIYDERHTKKGDPYSFQVLFVGATKETPSDTFERINQAYQAAYVRYINVETPNDEALSGLLFSNDELQWVVETLQQVSLTSVAATTGDLLGGFFEAITREGFKQSKGLFFTHYNIAVFMLEAIDLGELAVEKLTSTAHTNDRLPYIIDPSCGSGTFLLAAMRMITGKISEIRESADTADIRDQLASKFPADRPNEWAKDYIYGIEKREDLTISTKVNMVLHRDGNTHVFNDDGLQTLSNLSDRHGEAKFRSSSSSVGYYKKPRAETFDVIVSNPPFSITLDSDTQSNLTDNFDLATDKNSENLFLERWYQLLKPKGRLAAVLPESFFSTSENMQARIFLYRHFNVRAVVSLPSHAFAPWTPTRTSLLFAQKKKAVDEAKWATIFDKVAAELFTTRDRALASVKKLKAPGRATKAQLKDNVTQVNAALTRFMVDGVIAVSTESDAAHLDSARDAVKGFVIEAEALKAALNAHPGKQYLGLIVDEVGYRRTKRAENPASNDLFLAVESGAAASRLLNLNDAPDGWKIVASETGDDALSILKAEKLWA